MTKSLELLAPAKINLFLHITGRRPNGYHELQSVFQLVDWCDRIRLRLLDENQILRLGNFYGIEPKDDLVVHAAKLLKDRCAYPHGEIGRAHV